ncbi:MAG: SusC/RagA family TonB-linked outer membrane protein [Chitinophagales bacterium]
MRTLLFSLCLGMLLSTAIRTEAQKKIEKEISGFVADAQGAALAGVSINLKGSQRGTVTYADGKFKLVVTGRQPVLLFTSVGYEDLEVPVGTQTELTVTLQKSNKALEDVVVIGYGTQRRRDLTGAISSISSDHMNLGGTISNVGQAIQGRAAGVQVQQSDFSPGAGLNIVVRGGNSINTTNQPLFVIDGFISDNGSFINPNDIESIQILKDASAAAIYGARGGNGVVLITTKKGKSGKVSIEGDASNGTQSLTYKPDLINGAQYQSIQNAIATENNTTPPFNASFPTANTNWFNLATQQATVDNRSVSVSGGDKNSRIYMSGSYLKQVGVLKHTGLDRYSARVGAERTLSDKAKIGANVYAASSSSDAQRYVGDITAPLYGILTYGPNIPAYNADGSYYRYLGKDNPLATLLAPTNTSMNKLINGNMFLDYDIIPHLTYHISVGGEFSQTTNGQYVPLSLVAGLANGGAATEQMFTTERWLVEQYLTYKYTIGSHAFTALFGTTNQKDLLESITAGSKGYSTDQFLNNNLGAGGISYPAPTSNKVEAKLTSYFGRLNYSYNDKLLATFTLRDDISSRFGPNNRHGLFPSGALAYRFTDERFMKRQHIFSSLKARVGYGITGNDRIGNYAFLNTFTNYNTVLAADGPLLPGIEPAGLANYALKWESTAQFDAGLDMGFAKGRINATIDFYRKKTTDLLLSVPVGQWWGFSTQLANAGAIQNQGIELSVNTENISAKDFSWNTTFNIAYNRQKTLSLARNVAQISTNTANPSGVVSAQEFTRLVPGRELGEIYGYKYAGVIKTGEQYTAQPNSKPGDPKYVDVNGDGKITPADRTYLGNTNPHWLAGFSNDFHYKGFDLNIFFQGAFGYNLYDMNRLVLESTTGKDVLNRWVASTNENTSVPRQGYFLSTYGSYVNSRFVENASYVRLKMVSIGYNFPTRWLQAVKFVEGLRIYASGQNLLTFTKYKGTDPEVNVHAGTNPVGGTLSGASNTVGYGSTVNAAGGLDFNAFPAFRTFVAGVRLTIH